MDLSGVEAVVGREDAMLTLGASALASGDLVAFSTASPTLAQAREEVIHLLQQGRGQGTGVSDSGSAAERSAKAGRDEGTGADASVHLDALTVRANDKRVEALHLAPGKDHVITEAEDGYFDGGTWSTLAKEFGLSDECLRRFNTNAGIVFDSTVNPEDGARVYVPSAEEALFDVCLRHVGGDVSKAIAEYKQLSSNGYSVPTLKSARQRAAGDTGAAYGEFGDGEEGAPGPFYSPNSELSGARPAQVDGRAENAVNWNGADGKGFSKCSVFVGDVLKQAGTANTTTAEGKYTIAAKFDALKSLTQVAASSAVPGSVVQMERGESANESHVGILADYPEVSETRVSFSILGTGDEGAHEEKRTYNGIKVLDDGKTLEGRRNVFLGLGPTARVRFFRPAKSGAGGPMT